MKINKTEKKQKVYELQIELTREEIENLHEVTILERLNPGYPVDAPAEEFINYTTVELQVTNYEQVAFFNEVLNAIGRLR